MIQGVFIPAAQIIYASDWSVRFRTRLREEASLGEPADYFVQEWRPENSQGKQRGRMRIAVRYEAKKIHQVALSAADLAVMIGAPVGQQWWFVESLRAGARYCRDLSRASTTEQWAMR